MPVQGSSPAWCSREQQLGQATGAASTAFEIDDPQLGHEKYGILRACPSGLPARASHAPPSLSWVPALSTAAREEAASTAEWS
jgi:hypothetical protein